MSEENIRVINLKKKFNPESLIHFMVLASGQLVVQALINSPFHIFALVQQGATYQRLQKFALNFPSELIEELYTNLEKRMALVLFRH